MWKIVCILASMASLIASAFTDGTDRLSWIGMAIFWRVEYYGVAAEERDGI